MIAFAHTYSNAQVRPTPIKVEPPFPNNVNIQLRNYKEEPPELGRVFMFKSRRGIAMNTLWRVGKVVEREGEKVLNVHDATLEGAYSEKFRPWMGISNPAYYFYLPDLRELAIPNNYSDMDHTQPKPGGSSKPKRSMGI